MKLPPPPPIVVRRPSPPPPPVRVKGELPELLAGRRAWIVLLGNNLARLRELPAGCVHHITTSPPYWSLRDYGVSSEWWGGAPDCTHEAGAAIPSKRGQVEPTMHRARAPGGIGVANAQAGDKGAFCTKCLAWFGPLGLEPDPKLFAYHLVLIFRECRRALHDSGTLLLNLGDSFWGNSPVRGSRLIAMGEAFPGGGGAANWNIRDAVANDDYKQKDRVFLPHMVAAAMRQPWVRCKSCGSTEHLMWWGRLYGTTTVCPSCLKPAQYDIVEPGWYIRMDSVWSKTTSMPEPSAIDRPWCSHEYVFLCAKQRSYFWDQDAVKQGGKNLRSVWNLNVNHWHCDYCLGCQTLYEGADRKRVRRTTIYDEDLDAERVIRSCPGCGKDDEWVDHFAMFPSELPELGVKAGTSAGGCCSACWAPWERLGGVWASGCKCGAPSRPCLVLDPFNGSGTTILVARRLMRRGIGIEVKPAFAELTRLRMSLDFPLGDALSGTAKAMTGLGPPK